ncbi:MAG: SDR family oxidoreductase [Elainellaceae cyanobacterium]
MKAFVAGATGRTGQLIVKALEQRQIPTRSLVRDRQKAAAVLSDWSEQWVGDVLQPETLDAAIAGCDVVFCATGGQPSWDPTLPYRVDFEGTKNLVDAAKRQQVQHMVFVSSLCVSRLFHPLNLFWLILVWKKQAEAYLQGSGLTYTIVRPGGLKSTAPTDPLQMAAADTLFEGSLSREQVAEVCVEALVQPSAKNKLVEIIAQPDAPQQSLEQWFSSIA